MVQCVFPVFPTPRDLCLGHYPARVLLRGAWLRDIPAPIVGGIATFGNVLDGFEDPRECVSVREEQRLKKAWFESPRDRDELPMIMPDGSIKTRTNGEAWDASGLPGSAKAFFFVIFTGGRGAQVQGVGRRELMGAELAKRK